jgi:hypothetical protein
MAHWRGFRMPESMWRSFGCSERGRPVPVRMLASIYDAASDSYICRYVNILRVFGSSFRWFQNRPKDENT